MEHQQIAVASYQAVGTPDDSGLQQLVIIRIATNRHRARQFHLDGAQAQLGDENPSS